MKKIKSSISVLCLLLLMSVTLWWGRITDVVFAYEVDDMCVTNLEESLENLSGNFADDTLKLASCFIGYADEDAIFKAWAETESDENLNVYFSAYCLYNAGVDNIKEVLSADTTAQKFLEALEEKELYSADNKIVAGEVVFVDINEDSVADTVGITSEITDEGITVIQYCDDGCVCKVTYNIEEILGCTSFDKVYGLRTYSSEADGICVNITTDKRTLPDTAELKVMLYESESESYLNAATIIGYDEESDLNLAVLNIGFYIDDEEIEPDGSVNVSIDVSVLMDADEAESMEIQHLVKNDDETEAVILEGATDETVTFFEVDSFSDFTITWNSSTSATVKTYDTDGNSLDAQMSSNTFSGTTLSISTICDTVSISGYSYSYATVTLGSSTYGSSSSSVASIKKSSSSYTITYESGSSKSVSSTASPVINLYYSKGTSAKLGGYTVTDILGITDGKTLDDYYQDGHYYHVDIRISDSFSYIWTGEALNVVESTDLKVDKSWILSDATDTSEVVFNVYVQQSDGTYAKLYWDDELLAIGIYSQSTLEDGNTAVTITLNEDNNWEDTLNNLNPGNYKIEEIEVSGFESNIKYFTIDSDGSVYEGNEYTYTGSIEVTGVNWVEYTMNGNNDSSDAYYLNGAYANYIYDTDDDGISDAYMTNDDGSKENIAHIDASYYTAPGEATANNGDYEFFLDDNSAYGGRGLLYLTSDSIIWINVSYSVTYMDEYGNTITNDEVKTFTFTGEEWIEANLCTEQNTTNSNRGVDIKITGDAMLAAMGCETTSTTILANVTNTALDAADTSTTSITGTVTWEDVTEKEHDNEEEVSLIVLVDDEEVSSSTYSITWNDNEFEITPNDDEVWQGIDEGLITVEEEPIDGYSISLVVEEGEYNFTNTQVIYESFELPYTGGEGFKWMLAGLIPVAIATYVLHKRVLK